MSDWAMGRAGNHGEDAAAAAASRRRRPMRACIVALAVGLMSNPVAGSTSIPEGLVGSASSLQDTWREMSDSGDALLKEPLRLQSQQSDGTLSGTLYAVLDRPFADVHGALGDSDGWCSVLILDPNVHRCSATASGDAMRPSSVEVGFGRTDMPVSFTFQSLTARGDYLRVRLGADQGPFGTREYAIALEAAPLDPGHTVVHLSFAQRFGWAARVAMLAYFNTVGRGKVGFTVVDRDAQGRPMYASDLRGGLERNLMRYYFAILAYLDSLGAPREQQADRRVRTWLAYTERYPLQLHEEPGYFERKSPDVREQQNGR